MSVVIQTNHGEFTGRTIDSIVRRVYGRTANWFPAADHNSPDYGRVIRIDRHGTHLLASIIRVKYGPVRGWIYGPSISPENWSK